MQTVELLHRDEQSGETAATLAEDDARSCDELGKIPPSIAGTSSLAPKIDGEHISLKTEDDRAVVVPQIAKAELYEQGNAELLVISQHRADIDGLRALAVVAVVIYHLDEAWLPGGFVGVDIFFVISGYVVSASLLRRQSASRTEY